jgi:hypothetical protein
MDCVGTEDFTCQFCGRWFATVCGAEHHFTVSHLPAMQYEMDVKNGTEVSLTDQESESSDDLTYSVGSPVPVSDMDDETYYHGNVVA